MRFRFVIPALDLEMDEIVCDVPASYVPDIGTVIEVYHRPPDGGGEVKVVRCRVEDYDLALLFIIPGRSEYLAIYTLVPIEKP